MASKFYNDGRNALQSVKRLKGGKMLVTVKNIWKNSFYSIEIEKQENRYAYLEVAVLELKNKGYSIN